MRRLLAATVLALAVGLPRLALACPVCAAADARRSDAYVATTVLLSLLPLASIGGIAWLVWRRSGTRAAGAPDAVVARPSREAGAAPSVPGTLSSSPQ